MRRHPIGMAIDVKRPYTHRSHTADSRAASVVILMGTACNQARRIATNANGTKAQALNRSSDTWKS